MMTPHRFHFQKYGIALLAALVLLVNNTARRAATLLALPASTSTSTCAAVTTTQGLQKAVTPRCTAPVMATIASW